MPLIAKAERRTVPEDGVYGAALTAVDTVDDEWGDNRLRFDFNLEEHAQPNGLPTRISRTVNWVFGKQSALRELVESMLGRPLEDTEAAAGFDVETLIGCRVRLQLAQVESKNGNVYANIISIAPTDEVPW
jgi:hypothetical protein